MPSRDIHPVPPRKRPTPQALEDAAACLLSGGIVCHPTETCYGFACDITHCDAVERLFLLKKRAFSKPVSALFASVEEAKNYVAWNDAAESLVWALPGPLTIILPVKSDAPFPLFPGPYARHSSAAMTIGLRVSSHPVAAALARLAGRPVSTTSANISTLPEPYDIETMMSQCSEAGVQPDFILDYGTLPRVPPSTIVDCSDGRARITRQGSLRIDCERL